MIGGERTIDRSDIIVTRSSLVSRVGRSDADMPEGQPAAVRPAAVARIGVPTLAAVEPKRSAFALASSSRTAAPKGSHPFWPMGVLAARPGNPWDYPFVAPAERPEIRNLRKTTAMQAGMTTATSPPAFIKP
jgi:hypothetical protein